MSKPTNQLNGRHTRNSSSSIGAGGWPAACQSLRLGPNVELSTWDQS